MWLALNAAQATPPALNPIFDSICEMRLKVECKYPEKNEPNALVSPWPSRTIFRTHCVRIARIVREFLGSFKGNDEFDAVFNGEFGRCRRLSASNATFNGSVGRSFAADG